MRLSIISSFATIEKEIDWLDVNTLSGNFVIQPEHAPMILILQNNSAAILGLSTGKQENLLFKRGILHVERKSVTILGDL